MRKSEVSVKRSNALPVFVTENVRVAAAGSVEAVDSTVPKSRVAGVMLSPGVPVRKFVVKLLFGGAGSCVDDEI